jgi:hypothetical protein
MKTYLDQFIYLEFDHNYRARLTSIASCHRTNFSSISKNLGTASLEAVCDKSALSLKHIGPFFRRSASRFYKISATMFGAASQD